MLYILLIINTVGALAGDLIYYDTHTGKTLTAEEHQMRIKDNLTFWCVGSYKPCDRNEGRRVDATCNNLQYPHLGGPHTPSIRDVPAEFGQDNGPKLTISGDKLPPARKVRTESLLNGDIPDEKFTAMVPSYIAFVINALVSIHDVFNYAVWNPNCCDPESKNNPMCAPMEVPADDIVHQFSKTRCMGLTKPLTYQNLGCARNKASTPERINSASNFLDLSLMYGFTNEFRTMKDGLLQTDVENGNVWPVGANSSGVCVANVPPAEKRCHKFDLINTLLGENYFSMILWRLHNFIAKELKKLNPHWCDNQIFVRAKDINIALSNEIFYRELSPDFMGKENLIRDGVISDDKGFRDVYNETLKPQYSLDYLYSLRYLHTVQPGLLNLYDSDGNCKGQISSTDISMRTGWYAVEGNMAKITQSLFRDPMGKVDHVVDPRIAEKGFGSVVPIFDITTSDLHKGPLLGIAPYIKYRELCTGKKYRSFDDLADDITPVNIEIIKRTQKHVEDIPLMLGMWMEKKIPGGHVPRTFYCLSMRQMKRFAEYDRHWYERPTRPLAFNYEQLGEIRKASIAWVLCTAEPSVTHIQPKAFLREGPGNRFTKCKNIQQINLKAWKEAPKISKPEC